MKKLIIILIFIFINAQDGAVIYNAKGCYGCHGPTAMGGGSYPQLAGKKSEYLLKRFKQYRSDQMKTSGAFLMAPFAKNLTEEEVKILAEYLSNLSESKTEYFDYGTESSGAYGGGGS